MNIKEFFQVTKAWVLLIPVAFVGLGIVFNQAVLIANHDKFPVMWNDAHAKDVGPDGMLDRFHCLMTTKTHLNFLGDIINVGDGWESIGDILIDIGQWGTGYAPYVCILLIFLAKERG